MGHSLWKCQIFQSARTVCFFRAHPSPWKCTRKMHRLPKKAVCGPMPTCLAESVMGITSGSCVRAWGLNVGGVEVKDWLGHRRSQDFVRGCTFFLKKLTTFFCSSPSKDCLKLLNQPLPPPNLPKIDSSSAWGCTWCAGGALTNFPCKLRVKFFFSALGGAGAPPGYAYGLGVKCQNWNHRWHGPWADFKKGV